MSLWLFCLKHLFVKLRGIPSFPLSINLFLACLQLLQGPSTELFFPNMKSLFSSKLYGLSRSPLLGCSSEQSGFLFSLMNYFPLERKPLFTRKEGLRAFRAFDNASSTDRFLYPRFVTHRDPLNFFPPSAPAQYGRTPFFTPQHLLLFPCPNVPLTSC